MEGAKKIILLAGFLLMLGAGWLAYQTSDHLAKGHESKNWTGTEGVITKSGKAATYIGTPLDVQYLFEADGKKLDGGRVFYGGILVLNQLPDDQQAFLKKYPKGKSVIVYYNERNPKESVLEPGMAKYALWEFGASAGYVLFCVLYMLGIIKVEW